MDLWQFVCGNFSWDLLWRFHDKYMGAIWIYFLCISRIYHMFPGVSVSGRDFSWNSFIYDGTGRKTFDSIFGKASVAVLRKYPTPQKLKNAHLEKLTEILWESSGGRFGEWKARQLKEAAYSSFGIEDSCGVYSALLGMFLEQILSLTEQADLIEKQIASLLKKFNSQLTSIPGVGTVLAATILSEIGDIARFSSADKLLAFAGLDPSVKQSGEFMSNQNRMSKRGSPYLRRAIWLASTVAVQCDPMFGAYYEKKMSEGLHYMNVIGHVSRKMTAVIFAVLRDGQPYQPVLPNAG